MGQQKKTALILGEGDTEFFYFNSLRDVFRRIVIQPDYPKHTNMKELEQKISEGIHAGYDYIFCVIDMDTKDEEPERTQYARLKAKYVGVHSKPKKGIQCQVEFFETHRCTELFFLYYFRYTSRQYLDQDALIADLCQCVPYEKKRDFFLRCRGLHAYFEKHGGSLENAIANSDHSLAERSSTSRTYTYSELGRLMNMLKTIE